MSDEYPQKACPRFEDCSSSLCPMATREYLADLRGFWVEEDEICQGRGRQQNPLVVKQKKLSKVGAKKLFTLEMIESLRRIASGIEGLPFEACYGDGLERKAKQWIRNTKRFQRSKAKKAFSSQLVAPEKYVA